MQKRYSNGNGDPVQRWIGIARGWRQVTHNPIEQLVPTPGHTFKTHGLVIGATGSGKTNLLHHLIAHDIEAGHSVCVLDMRGDLVSAVVELCVGRVPPEKFAILDLRDDIRPMGFNPMHGAGKTFIRALNVLDVIASESESWGIQLAETLRNALLLLADVQEPLTQIEAIFYDPDYLDAILVSCRSEQTVLFWRRFQEMSQDKQSAMAMPVINKVSLLLATPTLRTILGHSNPIDLGRHLNTSGSVLLVSLAVDELHAAGRMMGRLVLSSICREIFARVNSAEQSRNPVRLFVDEFEHFGLQEFEAILAEGRRFGFSVVLAHQTLAQLSPKMRSMILGNVGTKFVFRCGREDGATLAKDLLGDPRAFDFCSLPVGCSVMWQSGSAPLEVEINEPLFKSVGRQSQAARDYLRQVSAAHRSVIPSRVRPEPRALPRLVKSNPDSAPRRVPKQDNEVRTKFKPNLEDWICG